MLVGGRPDGGARLGTLLGKAVREEEVPSIIDRLARYYLAIREEGENFIATVERVGVEPFKAALEARAEIAA